MDAVATTMKRLYSVWNRNYKACFVVADSPEEAVGLCLKSGHIRKAHLFRKFEDMTERHTAEGSLGIDSLKALLEGSTSGIVLQNTDGLWALA